MLRSRCTSNTKTGSLITFLSQVLSKTKLFLSIESGELPQVYRGDVDAANIAVNRNDQDRLVVAASRQSAGFASCSRAFWRIAATRTSPRKTNSQSEICPLL